MRHSKRKHRRGAFIKSILFFGLLAVLFIVSLIPPLRPTSSEQEKRDLTAFPEFSVESFLNGQFYRGIDDWFADTFPGRDSFLTLSQWIRRLYGVQTVQISGEVQQGDDIPDAPFTG